MHLIRQALTPWNARKTRSIILFTLALVALAVEALRFIQDSPEYVTGALAGGMLAATATTLGAIPALLLMRPSDKAQNLMFGFGAGVMLAASAFSLIIPGLDAAAAQGLGPWHANLAVGGSILLGAAVLLWTERLMANKMLRTDPHDDHLRRTWLVVIAIALHNIPEGLAIGTAYAGGNPEHAASLALGIAIQDIPEGLVVALALLMAGYSRTVALCLTALSGMVEPVAAVLGAAVVGYSSGLLPWSMGLTAGAMIFVVCHDMIPAAHRKGHAHYATIGLLTGFVMMMSLDTALG